MEILNKLWVLLITQNELVTKIFTVPTIFLEIHLSFLLIEDFFKFNYTTAQKKYYILFLSLISFFTKFFIPSPFNITINYLSMFVIIKFLFKTNIVKSIICTILPTIIFALSGIIVLKPMLIIFNISSSQAQYTPIFELLYLFILYFIIYLLILFFKHLNLSKLYKEDIDNKNKKMVLLNMLMGFFTICVQLAVTAYYTDILPFFITFLSFISLLTYFFISFFSLNKSINLQITQRNLENAENYNTTLSFLYDNVRAFKHDFDNMVFIIGGFIDKNDIEGLKQYYKNLEKDCERVNNLSLLNPELINNPGIYNLLIAKYKKAEEFKVEIHLEFFFDFNKLKMPIYDFSRILGILLDNAIEAAKDTNEKHVFIIIRDSVRNNTQIVNIKNNYINKNIDTTKIFEKGVTEKENHSGMGLWEVNQILKRNNNVNLITKKDNLYFEQNLEIYN